MSATALLAAALLAQPAYVAGEPLRNETHKDVAYEELANGEPGAAIAKIEQSDAFDSQDPSALINLGNAYAQIGMQQKAIAAYQAAISSRERYDLELADGRWMDSRAAARKALSALINANSQALRN